MQAHYSQIGTFLIAALVVYAVYMRFRRTFGRQQLQPTRMIIRMVLLGVIGCMLLRSALQSPAFMAAVSVGLLFGIGLALFGASRTRFERQGNQLYYIPHTYTGVLVSLLFLGRLVYRLIQAYAMSQSASHSAIASAPPMNADQGFASMIRSPLTLGMFYVLVGYYVCYYGVVLMKSKHAIVADPAAPAALQK